MHNSPPAAPRTEPRRLGVVARAEELAAIDSFLERAGSGPVALVFEGEPGIGKTTVWRAVLDRAPARTVRLLSCRPVEAEAKLAFASLADLVGPVADRVLPLLPDPQRSALEVALLRAVPGEKPPSPRAVAGALLSTLRIPASESPVVLAIDDQQWLDRATAEALAFALRRIEPHPVSVVTALRIEGPDVRDALALDLAFAERIDRRRLEPLGMSALHHVLRSRLGHVFPRPVLRRIADTSHGNPFFALEMGRALLDGHEAPAAGEPLPVPQAVSALVERRLARLPARTREALLVVAACSSMATSRLGRLLGRDEARSLARAVQAGIVEWSGDGLRFTHPLLAAGVYRSASPRERRALHERLAALVDDVEERARHLALATSAPDEAVARALDEGAALARLRGAPDAAGELAEQAAERTPPENEAARRRRRIQAAEHFFHAGDRGRARTLLEGALADGAPPTSGHARSAFSPSRACTRTASRTGSPTSRRRCRTRKRRPRVSRWRSISSSPRSAPEIGSMGPHGRAPCSRRLGGWATVPFSRARWRSRASPGSPPARGATAPPSSARWRSRTRATRV